MTRTVILPVPPLLAPFVSAIGYFRGGFRHARERVLPTGGIQLLINLHEDVLTTQASGSVQRTTGAAFQGPFTGPALIEAAQQRRILWVSFRAGGAYPLLGVPVSELRNQLLPAAQVWGRDGEVLRDRLLAAGDPATQLWTMAALLRQRVAAPPEPAIRYAAAALHGGARVAEVEDRLGWATRRLRHRFGAQIGLSPKRFARIRRLQRLTGAAAASTDPDWARLAYEVGYYDQAHMIHDFRELSGLTPSRYAPRSATEPNHLPLPE